MLKRDKLRKKLRTNPKGVTFNGLETLVISYEFRLERTSGSHHTYRYAEKTNGENHRHSSAWQYG
ncbi:MAG: hypothetical protein SGI73_05575 [Chloroflexota bacterium]|nr:hypothetical protein [Chloroflexota bacterium]